MARQTMNFVPLPKMSYVRSCTSEYGFPPSMEDTVLGDGGNPTRTFSLDSGVEDMDLDLIYISQGAEGNQEPQYCMQVVLPESSHYASKMPDLKIAISVALEPNYHGKYAILPFDGEVGELCIAFSVASSGIHNFDAVQYLLSNLRQYIDKVEVAP